MPDNTSQNSNNDSFINQLVYWSGIVFALTHIYFNTLGTLSELWVSAIHFGGFAFLTALMVPVSKSISNKFTRIFDMTIGILAIVVSVYLILFEDNLYARGVNFDITDWLASITAIIISMEMARRTAGLFIPILIAIALSYVFWWGQYVGGIFHFPGLSLETVLYRSYFTTEGMFGQIARISWTFVFMFILFGAFLVRSGAGDFIIAISRSVAGKTVGGPGLVAVLGSGLMGSVSGSAVANTVSTGVITIPLMKKAGFPPLFAAGVEAAASTGGQLMPPVMGAGVFIMASYTQIPYLEIIGYATLPALLYFLSVGFYVRVEAQKNNAHVADENVETASEVFKKGWYSLLPLAVLVGLLIYGFTPTYAAGLSIISVIIASWLGPKPMKLRDVLDSLSQGSKNMAATAMLLVSVGLIVNVVAMTGIGNVFSLMVTEWAGGSLLITLLLVGLASLILGMGLPVTASYIVLATLSAPAIYGLIAENSLIQLLADGQLPEAAKSLFMLIAPDKLELLNATMSLESAQSLVAQIPGDFKMQLLELAIAPQILTMILLSSHMIIFWLSQDSNVTPPVCLTAFAAAAIAKTPPMRTGLMAWKIAKGLYIVPLLFAYTNFIGGTAVEILQVFFFATIGLYAMVGFIEGYLESSLSWYFRILSGVSGVLLLWPHQIIALNLLGMLLFAGIFYLSIRKRNVS